MKVRANGIEVHYTLEGPPAGPVVTLSHSLGANLSMWDAQVAALATRYRVLRFDTRGHGQTQATPGPYTFELLAKDVCQLLVELGIERTHFVGLSMGGMIAQALAINSEEVLHSVVLCDTTSRMPPGSAAAFEERIRQVREQGLGSLVEATLERWFTRDYLETHGSEARRTREMLLATPVEGYVGVCHALARLDFTERLMEISTPTLIVVGDQDESTPVAESQTLQERIPDSRLVVLEGAKHLSNVEQADAFNRALLDFLAEV